LIKKDQINKFIKSLVFFLIEVTLMAVKEVTCQVRYMTDNANTINKNYTGLKSTITNDQIKALAQFFNQLTDDEVIVAYKITKDEIQVAD